MIDDSQAFTFRLSEFLVLKETFTVARVKWFYVGLQQEPFSLLGYGYM